MSLSLQELLSEKDALEERFHVQLRDATQRAEVLLLPQFFSSFVFLYYARACSSVIQRSLSLEYEPSSEPLHICDEKFFFN